MSQRITSTANPRVKYAARLRDSRFRRREGRFLVDGPREIGRAISAGFQLETLFYSAPNSKETTQQSNPLHVLKTERNNLHLPPYSAEQLAFIQEVSLELTATVMERVAYGERETGMVGLFLTPKLEFPSLRNVHSPLIVVLDQIEKPGNVGAILRSADAAGVDAVLVCDSGEIFHPNVIRASCGAVFSLPIATPTANEALEWLQARGIPIRALRLDATQAVWEQDWQSAAALVVGNEASGVSDVWRSAHVLPARIPMAGIADSLNASVSTAICLFEAVRQRTNAANDP